MLIFGLEASPYAIKHGVVHKNMGKVTLSRSYWTINFLIDYEQVLGDNSPIHKAIDNIDLVLFELNAHNFSDKEYFLQFKQQAQFLIEDINFNLDISNAVFHRNRKKRAILPFVGQILNKLFGTAKQSTINKMKNQMSILTKSNNDIIHVLNDRLTLINMTHKLVEKNSEYILQLSNAIQQLEKNVKSLASDISLLKFSNLIIYTLQQISLSITKYNTALKDVSRGHLPGYFIRPYYLQKILTGIVKQSKGVELPFSIKKLSLFYSKLSVDLLRIKNKYFIQLVVPMVSKNVYFLYKIKSIPLPWKNTSLWTTLNIENEYFLLSSEKDKFVSINNFDLIKCIKAKELVCATHQPVMLVNAKSLPCSLKIFFEYQNIMDSCRYDIASKNSKVFIVRKNKHSWYVSTQIDLKLILVCEVFQSHYDQLLHIKRGLNLIPAYDTCMWKNEFFQLHTGGFLHSANYSIDSSVNSLKPRVNISFTDLELSTSQLEVFNDTFINNSDVWNLNFLRNSLNQKLLEHNTQQIQKFKTEKNTLWYILLFFISLILIVALVIILYQCNVIKEKCKSLIKISVKFQENAEQQVDLNNTNTNQGEESVLYNRDNERVTLYPIIT